MSTLKIHPIPAFSDNYIWCLHDERNAVVVDPGDAVPVKAYLAEAGLELKGILITHHHWDHVNGIADLLKQWPDVPVWGPKAEQIPSRTQALKQADRVSLPFGTELEVIEVPGHTAGHIAYFSPSIDGLGPVLFSGDTLFSSGCGRLFEGTAEQMHHSLSLLKRLPADTAVFCTHEYTQANLRFAAAVEPDNADIQSRINQVQQLRDNNVPSLPSSIALEMKVNPFLRTDIAAVVNAVSENCGHRPVSDEDTFAKLRSWKDHF